MADIDIINSLKTDWTPEDFYNFEDLNRVEQATAIVRDKIAEFRGNLISLDIVTDRTEKHIEFAESLNRIEGNIKKLMSTYGDIEQINEMKTDWTYNMPFDFSDANRLEEKLQFMYFNIEANISNIPYAGMYIVGQEGVF